MSVVAHSSVSHLTVYPFSADSSHEHLSTSSGFAVEFAQAVRGSLIPSLVDPQASNAASNIGL
ncbi:hypothetical protein KXW65_007522 [Aspergillus fumigatus]|nr:hypothetical protein KXX38_003380 [Aspergillus fumigatus]KAH1399613.1 hypothetical protein KXX49_007953 [Aspergillus fumigatus]KAH2005004.1 hypothetical protein KXV45_001776 [Aspergillus fumigatus]KAH2014194.1 hypothetical protein KXV97_006858 [Aspergillus fumigatus]KAH2074286.1 hypothetical protein KXW21_004311 [Aspergillus fumigatus]